MMPDSGGRMHVELISVGRELLRGRIADANGPFLAEHFAGRGALVHRITIVDDTERAVACALREALERQPHLVVISGGLGPTADDCTLAGVADALQRPLKSHPAARRMVEAAYERLHARRVIHKTGLTAARDKLCSVPVGGEPLANPVGVAPGVVVRLTGSAVVICLPGEPGELRAVVEQAAPLLQELAPRRHRAVREVEAPTGDESSLRSLLDQLGEEYPMVWVKSHAPSLEKKPVRVVLSLEASAASVEEAESAVEGALQRLLALAAGVR